MNPALTIIMLKLFGVTFAGFGSIFLVAGIGMGTVGLVQQVGTSIAWGTVVTLESRAGEDGSSYIPVVEYGVNGTAYQCKGTVGFSPSLYKVGEVIMVRYPPAQPGKGHLDSFPDRWLIPLLFTGIGGVFSAVGFGFLLSLRRRDTPTLHLDHR